MYHINKDQQVALSRHSTETQIKRREIGGLRFGFFFRCVFSVGFLTRV